MPDSAQAHANLGAALHEQKKLKVSATAYRTPIRLRPSHAQAYGEPVRVLLRKGHFSAAVAGLQKEHELDSKQSRWRYPSAQWLEQAERLEAPANWLPAILKKDDRPSDNTRQGAPLAKPWSLTITKSSLETGLAFLR